MSLFLLVSPAISVSPEVQRMGKLLCLCLLKGECLHSQQLCAVLGQISALNFPPQVVQSISKKPAHVFWAWYLAFNMETLRISVVPGWWWWWWSSSPLLQAFVIPWDTLTSWPLCLLQGLDSSCCRVTTQVDAFQKWSSSILLSTNAYAWFDSFNIIIFF